MPVPGLAYGSVPPRPLLLARRNAAVRPMDKARLGVVVVAAKEAVRGVRHHVGGGDGDIGVEIEPVRVRAAVLGECGVVHAVVGPVGAREGGDGPSRMVRYVREVGGKERLV